MSERSLASIIDATEEAVGLGVEVAGEVAANLAPRITLRPYQVRALERFLFYRERYKGRVLPTHLLFHMATGSGKTVLMAALILELYAQGHRNVLFFVNSTQIIEKTKANFLDVSSSKYLFADPIRMAGETVRVREVASFDEADADSVNILFTTIHGLHTRLYDPKENAPTLEDFADRRVVMLADEGHHLNALTKGGRATKDDETDARDWETTVRRIHRANPENLLLEFTATAGLHVPEVEAKYRDKLLFDYSLRQFRADRYSKEIELRRADVPVEERMLQAVVLSQYRRKLAGEHGLALKPVVLMKSKNIAPSAANEAAFNAMIEGLDGARLEAMAAALPPGDTVGDGLRHVLRPEGGLSPDEFAREIRLDFAPDKVRNVNRPEDLARRQIELNSLEDRDNEVRVVFAVDKLNEGWDVLNLFDICRLYDKGTNATTNQEAQLIGRGARYWPFAAPDRPDEPREKRKYDADEDHPLRAIEQLHYHCSHDPAYLKDIRRALVEAGLVDADGRRVTVRVKEAFRGSDFFRRGVLFKNERRRNARGSVFALGDYRVPKLINLQVGHSGRTGEGGAFDGENADRAGAAMGSWEPLVPELGRDVLRHAMDANPFFHFASLGKHFPRLKSRADFAESPDFLGGVRLSVRGPKAVLAARTAATRLELARGALAQVEAGITANSHDHEGTRRFDPIALPGVVDDATITAGGPYRKRWRDWEGSASTSPRLTGSRTTTSTARARRCGWSGWSTTGSTSCASGMGTSG